MPARKSPPEPRQRSGADPEWARHTAQVKLRLDPLTRQALREGAQRRKLDLSAYVSALILADIPEE
jgi:hypothetical protein